MQRSRYSPATDMLHLLEALDDFLLPSYISLIFHLDFDLSIDVERNSSEFLERRISAEP